MNKAEMTLAVLWAASVVGAAEVSIAPGAHVRLDASSAELALVLARRNWSAFVSASQAKWRFPEPQEETECLFVDKGTKLADGKVALYQDGAESVRYETSFTPVDDLELAAAYVQLELPVREFAGSKLFLDGTLVELPRRYSKKSELGGGSVRSLTIVWPDGKRQLALRFDAPTCIGVNDSRRWDGKSFSVRMAVGDAKTPYSRGVERRFSCRMTSDSGLKVAYGRPVRIEPGRNWSTLDYRKDIVEGSALDFSGLGLQDAPAGKHGWIGNADGHFCFENQPGKAVRFYGCNFCFSANFPSHEEARMIVRRLIRMGHNSLRIHHHDNAQGLVKGAENRMDFNREMLDRLDYFLAEAYRNGIYVTTDLYVSRPVFWRDVGVDRPGKMPGHHYKCYVALDDRAFENWKTYARLFMDHVNPYTGRRNADEPGMPFVSLLNENAFWVGWSGKRNDPVVRRAYSEWLSEKRKADPSFCPEAPADAAGLFFHEGENAALAMFLADMERRSVKRQKEYLRSIGCKALFTSMNCGPDYAPMQVARSDCFDYVDTHFYVDHPRFPVEPWKLPSTCPNENPFLQRRWRDLAETAFVRLTDKPFTVSEWNFSGPGRYRGVGGVATGALAALQDWSALWRFAYSHSRENWSEGKGRLNYFDLTADPLMRFSDIAVVLLFLRGDMPSFQTGFALDVTGAVAGSRGGAFELMPEWGDSSVWKARVATVAAGRTTGGLRRLALHECYGGDKNPCGGMAGNTRVSVDGKKGAFAVVTRRTCGGFRESGRLVAGPLTADLKGVPSTLWVSSLDDRPLERSKRMLLVHLTDVQNGGAVYGDEKRTTLLEWGKGKPVVCNGGAHVSLAIDGLAQYAVWELATDGSRVRKLKSHVRSGRLVFEVSVEGPDGARILYEIERIEDAGPEIRREQTLANACK